LLRHPVDRAVSHYLMLRSYGLAEVAPKDITKDPSWIKPSLYSRWVSMWEQRFSDQILVIDFRRITENPNSVLNSVYGHFQVGRHESSVDPRAAVFQRKGASRYPYLSWLVTKRYNRWLRGRKGQAKLIKLLNRCGVRDLYHFFFTLGRTDANLEEFRRQLETVLAKEIQWYESYKFN
jgi:hypothetical protein